MNEFVQRYFGGVRLQGGKVKCPAHDDIRASLAIKAGKQGRILLTCHAGCPTDQVVAALGLTMKDLMGDAKTKAVIPKRKPMVYPTPAEAEAALVNQTGATKVLDRYKYWTVKTKTEVRAIRLLPKAFRQMSRNGEGWINALPEKEKILPWTLEECSAEGPIFVEESEKACLALRKIGVSATSTIMGASSLSRTDLSALQGRRVYVWPHNDDGGQKYADELEKLIGAVVMEPWGPEHADVEDWLNEGHTAEELWALARTYVPDVSQYAPSQVPRHCVPPVLMHVADGIAAATGCGPEIGLLSLYPILGTAIGNKTRIQVKAGFETPASFYSSIWGDTGDGKSHPMTAALIPLKEIQQKRIKDHEIAMKLWRKRHATWSKEMTTWKRKTTDLSDPPTEPEEPVLDLIYLSDTTIEAMERQLANNTGKLQHIDEGIQWYCGAGQYKSGGGLSDKAKYCEWWNGSGGPILRMNEIRIPAERLCVNILMGCQTEVMARRVEKEDMAIGLFGRMLMGLMPDNEDHPPQNLDPEVRATWVDTVRLLFYAKKLPELIPIDAESQLFWDAHIHSWQYDRRKEKFNDLRGAFAKLATYTARLALVHYVLDRLLYDEVEGDEAETERRRATPWVIRVEYLEDAFELVKKWQVPAQGKVYAQLAMTTVDHESRKHLQLVWAVSKGSLCRHREFMQRAHVPKDECRAIFNRMQELGWGQVIEGGPLVEDLRRGSFGFLPSERP